MLQNFLSALFALCAIIVMLLAGSAYYMYLDFGREGPLINPTFFSVTRGENLTSVTHRLHSEGVIGSSLVFQFGTFVKNKRSRVQFGHFEIPAKASPEEVLNVLTRPGTADDRYRIQAIISGGGQSVRLRERAPGTMEYLTVLDAKIDEGVPSQVQDIMLDSSAVVYSLTVVEGLTSWQIATGLNLLPFFQGTIEPLPEEGVLSPNTYSFRLNDTRQSMIDTMQSVQARILEEEWQNRAEDTPLNTPEEALILASIIEKETGLPEERHLVASVFVNRLRRGWALQADPTLVYGLTDGQGSLGRGLRRSELDEDTPYNTYTRKGLPPGPISNPSRASIHAALNPGESDFFYFVADGSGGHAFAKNYQEHQKNVQRWRRLKGDN